MTVLCYCTTLRNAARRMTAVYDAALAPIGIGTAQFSLLRGIDVKDPISLTELSTKLDLDRSTLGRNLRLLEKMGLVVSGVGADQRVSTFEPTKAGRKALKDGAPLWERAQQNFEAQFSPEKAQGLRAILSTI